MSPSTGCGDIISFIGDPLQQCTGCKTSFRVSISTLIGVAAHALQTLKTIPMKVFLLIKNKIYKMPTGMLLALYKKVFFDVKLRPLL
jgi:hypothetical protein